MTMPHQRSKAVIEAGAFLTKLKQDARLPESVRLEARRLLKHYPSYMQVVMAGQQERSDSKLVIEPVFGSESDLTV